MEIAEGNSRVKQWVVVDPNRTAADSTISQATAQPNIKDLKNSIRNGPSCVNDIMGRVNETPLSTGIKLGENKPSTVDVIRLLMQTRTDIHTVDGDGISIHTGMGIPS